MTGQGTEVRFPDLEVIHMDFHLHCPSVQMAMHESLKKTCRNEELSPARQRPDLLLQNLCIEDKNPHNSLSRCYCRPLFESVSSNTFFWSFIDPRPLSQLWKRCSLPLRFLNFFFKGALLPYFFSLVLRQLLIVRISQLEDIFSILRQNLCARLSPLTLKSPN